VAIWKNVDTACVVTIPKKLSSIGLKRLIERALWTNGLQQELVELLSIDYSMVAADNFCVRVSLLLLKEFNRGLSGGAKDYYAIITEED
jgi:hypothetical protein